MSPDLYRVGAVARHQAVLLRRAPGPLLTYTVMPILLTVLLEPVHARLDPGTSAIDATAPGMVVMFALFMTGVIGDSLLLERGWRTWDRLRSTPTRAVELLTGKVLPLLGALLAQQVVVFGFAALAYHLDLVAGGWRLAVVGLAWAVCVTGCGTALATAVRGHSQLTTVKDIGTLALAGLGGALLPLPLLPSWATAVSPASPGYWAMRGYTAALAPGDGVPVVAVAILLGTGAAGLAVAALRTATRP
jgi:ABC-2 type transport system permease protein